MAFIPATEALRVCTCLIPALLPSPHPPSAPPAVAQSFATSLPAALTGQQAQFQRPLLLRLATELLGQHRKGFATTGALVELVRLETLISSMSLPMRLRSPANLGVRHRSSLMPVLTRPAVRNSALPGTVTAPITSTNGAVPSTVLTTPVPIVVNTPEPVPGILPPPATFKQAVAVGVMKANLGALKTIIMGMLAGGFISLASFSYFTLLGNIPGLAASQPGLAKLLAAAIFPYGLMMIIVGGAELFTGNTAVMTMSALEGKISVGQVLRNWILSYTGNLIGCLLMVAAVGATGLLAGNPVPLAVATAKTSIPLGTCIIRAILCNWLVCQAVWQSMAATSMPGRIMAIWPPIMAFVALGLEHSVANMFMVPMGIALGAKVTFMDFLVKNLLPVTLGNMIAGTCIVGLGYCAMHGSLLTPKKPAPAAA